MSEYAKLVCNARRFRLLRPLVFKTELGRHVPQFEGMGQQDSQVRRYIFASTRVDVFTCYFIVHSSLRVGPVAKLKEFCLAMLNVLHTALHREDASMEVASSEPTVTADAAWAAHQRHNASIIHDLFQVRMRIF